MCMQWSIFLFSVANYLCIQFGQINLTNSGPKYAHTHKYTCRNIQNRKRESGNWPLCCTVCISPFYMCVRVFIYARHDERTTKRKERQKKATSNAIKQYSTHNIRCLMHSGWNSEHKLRFLKSTIRL